MQSPSDLTKQTEASAGRVEQTADDAHKHATAETQAARQKVEAGAEKAQATAGETVQAGEDASRGLFGLGGKKDETGKTTVQPSQTGPATYTGGAPRPDELHAAGKKQQGAQHGKEGRQHHEEGKEKKGMMDKARSAAHDFAETMSHATHSVESLFKKSDKTDEKWFKDCFPNVHDELQKVYEVNYIDGQAHDHTGRLAVTNHGVHFADGAKGKDCKVQESVLYKNVASVKIEDDKALGHRLNVYTTDRKVLQFKNFRAHNSEHSDAAQTMREAQNCIDHCWRKVAQIPNPAATYCTS